MSRARLTARTQSRHTRPLVELVQERDAPQYDLVFRFGYSSVTLMLGSSKWMMYANANHVYLNPPSSGGKVYINGVNPLARKAWTYNTNATKSSTGGMIEGTAYTFSGIFGIGGVPPQALGGLVKCSNVFGYIINQTTFISLKTVQATINAGDAINIYGFEVGE